MRPIRQTAFAVALVLASAAAYGAQAQTLRCRGADTMQPLADKLGQAFMRQDGSALVEVGRHETLSAEAFVDLLGGRVDCVLMARELFPAERAAYIAEFGREPVVVPVALGSYATLHATHAIAIYVNAANPISRLSVAQLGRLFGASLPDTPPAVTRWGQLGLKGAWARRPVHIYGMRLFRDSGNPPGIVNFVRQRLLNGADMRSDIRVVADRPGMPALTGIVAQVADDEDGIGYSGFGFARPGTKTLALCTDTAHCYAGTPDSVARGLYPLRRTIYLAFPRQADGQASPLARKFARFVLNAEGQRIIAASVEHFLPLPPRELPRAKLLADGTAPAVPPPFGIADLPAYTPQDVRPPADAGYVRADGKIAVIGYNDMRSMLAAVDLLFMASHPGVQFALDLRGTRTAPAPLAAGRSAFAPMGADFEAGPLAAYSQTVGAPPLRIRVAHDAVDPVARSSPLAVYVHRGNPLKSLSKEQLARVFSGAVTNWGELGLTGTWRTAPVHLYGLSPATPLARIFSERVLDGRSLAPSQNSVHSRTVTMMMANDPYAIGFADLNQQAPHIKPLALSACEDCAALRGSPEDIVAGNYLLDRHLLIFLRKQPGVPLDPFVREYLRLVLSREGQAAIAASSPHYLPLNSTETGTERAKLD